MTSEVWLPLSNTERNLLREALAVFSGTGGAERRTDVLMHKIDRAGALPETILRVKGGFVDIEENPNLVRIFDYDCDGVDDEDLSPDEQGRACIVSEFEPFAGE